MPTIKIAPNLRPAAPLLVLSGLLLSAGGVLHLREWIDTYRHVPASLPGADVVRVGFVVDVVLSAALTVALLGAVIVSRRVALLAVTIAWLFEAASLGTLIQSRRGTVLGWAESGWSGGAAQIRAAEIATLFLLVAAAVVTLRTGRNTNKGTAERADDIGGAGGTSAPVPAS